MDRQQMLMVADIIQRVIDELPIEDALLKDPAVIDYFFNLSSNSKMAYYHFFRQCSLDYQVQLTHMDLIEEELVIDLHISYGFSSSELSQWMRGLDPSSYLFFVNQARFKNVIHLDAMIEQAQSSYRRIDGLYVEALPADVDQLMVALDRTCQRRLSLKQFQHVLSQVSPSEDDIQSACDFLIVGKKALGKITGPDGVRYFRLLCLLLDHYNLIDHYQKGICQVVDRLLMASSIKKCMALLNTLSYGVIKLLILYYIQHKRMDILSFLNESLPTFQYGHLRKIVRRHNIGLNY